MDETIYKMLNTSDTKINKLKRKVFLEPIAKNMGIKSHEFKNKKLLVREMLTKAFANDTDPVTLIPINEIESNRLIIWNQMGNSYAADVESLYFIIKNGNTINPWAIDKATGIQQATEPEKYSYLYDMKYVPNLIIRIEQKYKKTCKLQELEEYCNFNECSENARYRTIIDRICPDLYIFHVINYFEMYPIRESLLLLHMGLTNMMFQYQSEIRVIEDRHLHSLNKMQKLLIQLESIKIIKKNTPNIKLIANILMLWKDVLDTGILVGLFEFFETSI